MNNRKISSLALAMTMALTLPSITHADNQDTIDYRRHIMATLQAQSAAVGQILSGAVPDDNFAAHLDVIATTAATALKSFEPKVPGGESSPDVWKNWADFSKRMKEFADKTALTAKIAKEQGKDAASEHVLEALSCKSCHDVYRVEKKK